MKQFLTSGEKMTQKSNFLGKTNKNNGFTSNWPTRQNFTTTTNKIALCPERVNARLQVDSLLSLPPRRSSNPRTPFVLHSKLSTLLSGLAGHSFSCSLYCILTHPCELSGGSQFRQIISIFLNGYIAICLVIDLLLSALA